MALGKNLTKKTAEKDSPVKEGETEVLEAPENSNNPETEGKNPETEEEEEHQQSSMQFCVFKSGGEEYAIPINLVKEVVHFPKISPLTQMPAYIIGMTNVRGNIYGVLDLALFFKATSDQEIENKYILVLEHDKYQMAIAIPDVPDTMMIQEDMMEELSASRLKSVIGQKYLKGIIKKDRRMIILFDILGMISGDKFTLTS